MDADTFLKLYCGFVFGIAIGVWFELRWKMKTQQIVNEAIKLDRARWAAQPQGGKEGM